MDHFSLSASQTEIAVWAGVPVPVSESTAHLPEGQHWLLSRKEGEGAPQLTCAAPAHIPLRPDQASRCIIPATSFLGCRRNGNGVEEKFSFSRSSGAIFGIGAMLGSVGRGRKETFSIVAVQPSALLANLFSSQPLVLSAHDFEQWLDPSLDHESVRPLVHPLPVAELKHWMALRS